MTEDWGSGHARRHATALARVAVRLLDDEPKLSVPSLAHDLGVSAATIYKHWSLAHPGRPPRGRVISDAGSSRPR